MAKKPRRQASLAQVIRLAQYAIDEKLAQEIPKVLDLLLGMVENVENEPRDRIAAAKFLLEYFMPKKQSPLVQISQDNRKVEIRHLSHLGLPTVAAEIPENLPPIPPRRRLVELSEVDASDMIPADRDRMEPVPFEELPPKDISMVKVASEPIEAPVEIAPLLMRDQPNWRKGFW